MRRQQSYTINVCFEPPPIPTNAFNWCASLLDDEEGCYARGETPEQAVANFVFALEC